MIRRLLAPVTVILFTCSAVALQEQRGTDPSVDLAAFVNGEWLAQQLPGLAAVVVRSDGPPRIYVSGERRIGTGDLITPADRMHLGSMTKAITATLIGALAERQLMTFETTIGQTFPELSAKIQPAYRDVSVRQLLSHAAGIPTYGLKATTIRELQKTPASAMAWAVLPRNGVESHQHFGSYGAYVAYATIQPSRDVAVGVFTNLGSAQGLRDAVASVALRIATLVATTERAR